MNTSIHCHVKLLPFAADVFIVVLVNYLSAISISVSLQK